MCRRAKRHEARSETCHSSLPGGHYTPLVADHLADAIRHARNSEQFATVGIDLISNFANHFASLLYPESQAAGPGQAPAAAQPQATTQAAAAPTQPQAASSTSPVNVPLYPNLPQTADVSAQPEAVSQAPQSQSQPTKAATPPPVAARELVLIEDDIDDDDYVQVPLAAAAAAAPQPDHNSSGSSVESVEKNLMDAFKEGRLPKD